MTISQHCGVERGTRLPECALKPGASSVPTERGNSAVSEPPQSRFSRIVRPVLRFNLWSEWRNVDATKWLRCAGARSDKSQPWPDQLKPCGFESRLAPLFPHPGQSEPQYQFRLLESYQTGGGTIGVGQFNN